MPAAWLLLLLSFTGALALAAFLANRRFPVPLDRPNERSLHSVAVPRGGGLAVFAAWAAAWPWLPLQAAWVVAALLVLVVSLWDDIRGIAAPLRLLVHCLAAGFFVMTLFPGHSLALQAAETLWVVWMLNLFNFMDGSDGLAAGMAAIGFGCYALASAHRAVPEFALLNATLAAACLGFLGLNFHPARIFLGDVGSVPLGFLAGAFGLYGVDGGYWPPAFALLVFLPFVADATVTLLRRMLRGERVWQAHREHYYQRLVQLGWGHRGTALAYYALMLATGGSALAMMRVRPDGLWPLLAFWLIAYGAIYAAIDRAWMRHRVSNDKN